MRLGLPLLGLAAARRARPNAPVLIGQTALVGQTAFVEPYTVSGYATTLDVPAGRRLFAALTGRPAPGDLSATATFGGQAMAEIVNTKRGPNGGTQNNDANVPFWWVAGLAGAPGGAQAFELSFAPDCYDSVLLLVEAEGGDWPGLAATAAVDPNAQEVGVGYDDGRLVLAFTGIRGDAAPATNTTGLALQEAARSQPGGGSSACSAALHAAYVPAGSGSKSGVIDWGDGGSTGVASVRVDLPDAA